MTEKNTLQSKTLVTGLYGGGWAIKGGKEPEIKILRMDCNNILLEHVQINITEKIKPCSVIWLFVLIQSTCFQF